MKEAVYNDLWATRSAGFLIPLFSVRTEKSLGIGDIGNLYALIDWAADLEQRVIQMLPLNDLKEGDASPYAAVSLFAVNPLYIDIHAVDEVMHSKAAKSRLKRAESSGELEAIRRAESVDYKRVRSLKMELLFDGFDDFYRNEWQKGSKKAGELSMFIEQESYWLKNYATFTVLKEIHDNAVWSSWPDEYGKREPLALEQLTVANSKRIIFLEWLQWVFTMQWQNMRAYAHKKGVYLMGDVAFYPGYDSVDVWSKPELFLMKEDLSLSATSGAPPDQFNIEGQNWGTPLYDWKKMESDDYFWWQERIKRVCDFFDIYRLDHFRGFESFWRVPSGVKASEGSWVKGPAEKLLHRLLKVSLEERLVIPLAEDLGDITPEVHSLRERLGIAGYKTFIFGWGEGEASGIASGYRYPEGYAPEFLATTWTHDTPTLYAWWVDLRDDERSSLLRYLGMPEDEASFTDVKEALFERLFYSSARFVIIPFQDIFELGDEHRVNMPGTFGEHNWSWRMPLTLEELVSGASGSFERSSRHLKRITSLSKRTVSAETPGPVEMVKSIPSPGTVQERKSAESFNIWITVTGKPDKPPVCSIVDGEKPLSMSFIKEMKSGISLYKGEICAEKRGLFSLRILGNNVDVVIKDCLKVM